MIRRLTSLYLARSGSRRWAATFSVVGLALVAAAGACGAERGEFDTGPSAFDEQLPVADAGDCPYQCSLDGRSVIRSCTGEVVETCPPDLACGAARCQEPCAAAAADRSSNGCEFYFPIPAKWGEHCYATFVVNTSTQPVDLSLDFEGEPLDISKATLRTNPGEATLVQHEGAIAPGESVVLFVSGGDPNAIDNGTRVRCPKGVVPAVERGALARTGIASSFHLNASAPVSLVAMYPFGGATSVLPTTTLVLPVVTWGKQHLVVNPWESNTGRPSTQIVASEDETEVTIIPTMPIQDGPGVNGVPAKVPAHYHLDKGQYLQLVQFDELSGSIVTSDKPTTVFGGHTCAFIPSHSNHCDTLWQQIPTFEQWGSEYVAVGYRPRVGSEHETMPYRIVAARDGTRLDYDPAIPVGAPTEMSAGEVATFPAAVGDAFVVRTQDADHPIYVAAYMTGHRGQYFGSGDLAGAGDPEFVNVVPAGQWLNAYSFYADPTYKETSLVVVRAKQHGKFEEVWLECAGDLTDWKPVGERGDYEYVRVDLSRDGGPGQSFGDKTCRTGLQRMKSAGPFTATLWGWSYAASYAYPGGMAHRKLVTSPLVSVQ